jgi:ribosomal protein S18 acetylase RimI-like enzyme
MNIGFTTVADFGLAPTAELLARAFADYFLKIPFTVEALRHTAQMDQVDFTQSPVVLLDGEPAGAALLARRGPASRVAGMALVPVARRQGAGRAMMERLLAEARARGDRRMVLEVIKQNTAALRLYESAGFTRIRRLVGFAGPAPAGLAPVSELAEVNVRDVAAAVSRLDGAIGWPWQISGETIALLPPPAIGYALDGAWTALLSPAGPVVTVRTVVVEGSERREERAVRLLQAVMARHPAETWRVSALWPEELSGCFTRAGLVRQDLTQWQMVRELR